MFELLQSLVFLRLNVYLNGSTFKVTKRQTDGLVLFFLPGITSLLTQNSDLDLDLTLDLDCEPHWHLELEISTLLYELVEDAQITKWLLLMPVP